ncbi:MAG: T9SS type A sorting domain-containing protein [Bacteroidia bacterium]
MRKLTLILSLLVLGFTFASGQAPVAYFSANDTILCAGGTVQFTDTSHNTPTSWKWYFQNGTPSTSTMQNPSVVFNNPGIDSVKLVVTNASGSDSLTKKTYIMVNALPAVKISATPSICDGVRDTLRAIDTTGDASPLMYSWSNGGTNDSINIAPSASASYKLTITDSNGCMVKIGQSVTVNPLPVVSITGGASDLCSGSVLMANESGTGTDAVAYLWSGGSKGTNDTAVVLSATTYDVTATDKVSGCVSNKASQSVTTVNPLPTISITATQTTVCLGLMDTLKATDTTGDASPLMYDWSNGGKKDSIKVTPPAGSTIYSLTVTDANGCMFTATQSVTADEPAIQISGHASVCKGAVDTLRAADTTGDLSPLTFLWKPGNVTSNIIAGSIATPTTFTLTITDKMGCKNSATHTITVNALPTVSISGNVLMGGYTICKGSYDTLTANATGGAGSPYTFLWSTNGTYDTVMVSKPNTYSVTATDSKGCVSKKNSVSVTVDPLPTINVSGTSNISGGSTDTLIAGGGVSYVWSGGITGDTDIVKPLADSTFMVTGTASTGCSDTASFFVSVAPNGIDGISNPNSTSLYPNPAMSSINLLLRVRGTGKASVIEIVDASGRMVMNENTAISNGKVLTLDISALASGMYFAKVITDNESQVVKFVKQ